MNKETLAKLIVKGITVVYFTALVIIGIALIYALKDLADRYLNISVMSSMNSGMEIFIGTVALIVIGLIKDGMPEDIPVGVVMVIASILSITASVYILINF